MKLVVLHRCTKRYYDSSLKQLKIAWEMNRNSVFCDGAWPPSISQQIDYSLLSRNTSLQRWKQRPVLNTIMIHLLGTNAIFPLNVQILFDYNSFSYVS